MLSKLDNQPFFGSLKKTTTIQHLNKVLKYGFQFLLLVFPSVVSSKRNGMVLFIYLFILYSEFLTVEY